MAVWFVLMKLANPVDGLVVSEEVLEVAGDSSGGEEVEVGIINLECNCTN